MTRVEKYREYRREILNSFYVDKKETKMSITSSKVSSATMNKDTGNTLSVDEVLEAYELYDDKKETIEKKKLSTEKKKELLFFLIGIGVAVILLTSLIIVGILAVGGK